MSKYNKEMIDDLADKLLIGLTKEENQMVLDEFEIIENQIENVTKIDNISSIEPMTHALDDFKFELREDKVEESIPTDEILANCKEHDGREVIVPKVVE